MVVVTVLGNAVQLIPTQLGSAHMSDDQHDEPKLEGEKPEQDEDPVLFTAPPEDDEDGQSPEPWYKRHAFDILLACVVIILGSILIPVFVVPWLSGSSSTRSAGIGTIALEEPGNSRTDSAQTQECGRRDRSAKYLVITSSDILRSERSCEADALLRGRSCPAYRA